MYAVIWWSSKSQVSSSVVTGGHHYGGKHSAVGTRSLLEAAEGQRQFCPGRVSAGQASLTQPCRTVLGRTDVCRLKCLADLGGACVYCPILASTSSLTLRSSSRYSTGRDSSVERVACLMPSEVIYPRDNSKCFRTFLDAHPLQRASKAQKPTGSTRSTREIFITPEVYCHLGTNCIGNVVCSCTDIDNMRQVTTVLRCAV